MSSIPSSISCRRHIRDVYVVGWMRWLMDGGGYHGRTEEVDDPVGDDVDDDVEEALGDAAD